MARREVGVRVERKFYDVARWFGLTATTCALVVTVGAGAFGVQKLLSAPDTQIRTPSVSYSDFRLKARSETEPEHSSSDPTLQEKEEEAAQAKAEADREERLKPHLDKIVSGLSTYATKLGQDPPSAPAVGDFVRKNQADITSLTDSDDLGWAYVEGLEKAVSDLVEDDDRLSKLSMDDPQRVRWDKFIDWYTQRYKESINNEFGRIRIEAAAATLNHALAPWSFYVAGAAFGVFIYMTMLLVLLRIERNTRSQDVG